MSAIGWDGTLSVNDGVAAAQVAIPDVVTIDPPAMETQIVESKRLDLTDRVIEKVKSLRDPGTWSFQVEHEPDLYDRLLDLVDNTNTYIITTSDGTIITTSSIMTKAKVDPITADGIMMVTCDLTAHSITVTQEGA